MSDVEYQPTDADHERAVRAGKQAMAKIAAEKAAPQEHEQKQRPGLRFWSGWLALTQFIAFIVAIVDLFHSVTFNPVLVGNLLTWPVKVSPHWLGVAAALPVFLVLFAAWAHFAEGTAQVAAKETGPGDSNPAPAPAKAKKVRLPGLGVYVRGCDVHVNEAFGKRLGDLAGAHAEITDGTRPHHVGTAVVAGALFLPLALIGLSRGYKASAFVVFADGTWREQKIRDKADAGKAQRDVIKFNALAAAATRG